ncbi:MAG: hypothetical protein ACOYEQ_02865 [Bacillota bacterium]
MSIIDQTQLKKTESGGTEIFFDLIEYGERMAPMRIKPKKHIVWFHDREIDLSDPTEALRYYE